MISFSHTTRPFSNGSTNTLTNDVKDEMTPILMKKKSHSAPESDTSSSIYSRATPVPKKKLSLDGRDETSNAKEKCQKFQEKELDEASNCSSAKAISPAATLTSVNDN